jgi:hypothetical protein
MIQPAYPKRPEAKKKAEITLTKKPIDVIIFGLSLIFTKNLAIGSVTQYHHSLKNVFRNFDVCLFLRSSGVSGRFLVNVNIIRRINRMRLITKTGTIVTQTEDVNNIIFIRACIYIPIKRLVNAIKNPALKSAGFLDFLFVASIRTHNQS